MIFFHAALVYRVQARSAHRRSAWRSQCAGNQRIPASFAGAVPGVCPQMQYATHLSVHLEVGQNITAQPQDDGF